MIRNEPEWGKEGRRLGGNQLTQTTRKLMPLVRRVPFLHCFAEGQSMNVTVAEPAQIALRNLSDDDRRRVWAWIDNLKRWESDPFVQQHAKKLDAGDNTYMLLTSTEFRLFFSLEKDAITVLDVAKKATIIGSGER